MLQCKVCLWTIRHHSDLTFLIINSYFSCLCPNKLMLVCVTDLSGYVCIYVAASTTFLTKCLFHAAVFCASSFPVQQQIVLSCLFLLFLYSLCLSHTVSLLLSLYIFSLSSFFLWIPRILLVRSRSCVLDLEQALYFFTSRKRQSGLQHFINKAEHRTCSQWKHVQDESAI